MKLRRPPLLLSLTAGAAALTLASTAGSALSASGKPAASGKTAETSPSGSRMGVAIKDDLAQRNAKSRAQARALDLKEQAAKAAQARLAAALKASKQAEDAPAATPVGKGKSAPEEESETYDTLARIYQAMKPAKAAPVFEQLELDVQTAIAKRMRERSAAMIMAAMSPKGAARLSMALAGRKEKPVAASVPLPVDASPKGKTQDEAKAKAKAAT